MNVLLLIPDGVGVRNFLIGNFLKELRKTGSIHVLHVIPDNLLTHYNSESNGNIQWQSLIPYRESPLSYTLRYSLAYAQMYWANTRAMHHNLSLPVKGSWRTQAVRRVARIIGKVSSSSARIQKLDYWHCKAVSKLPEVGHYQKVFQQIKPSVLFCSHQRPPIILPPVLAAKSLGIPTATFIFSWDNLTSKGRIAAPFDHYLVWSDLMRQELLRYYPDVSPENVHVVGTPQFDPYANKKLLWSREVFFNRIGGTPSRPLICYSGGDTGTCPEDPQHVRILMDLIRTNQIKGNPQLLLRPAPVDDGKRYDNVCHDYPEIIYARPAWVHARPGDWSRVLPLPEDVEFLSNLTHHADLNINMASTMTIDFAIHDKPVVNIAFDVASPPPFGQFLWDFFYQFEHYTPVIDLEAARFARSPEELAEHVNSYMENPSLDRDGRQKLVALEIGHPVGQSSQRVIETLANIALR